MVAKQPAENRSKVVIGVDDVAANLALLEVALRSAGYTFIGVASGAAMIEVMNRVRPRLDLLDIRMPDMDGFEACRRLRLRHDFATVPVAFITACKTETDVLNGLAAGGNDFIVKPYTLQHLLERVAHWVAHPLRPGTTLPPVALP
jgi:DNA-binding response OmpR family regulator